MKKSARYFISNFLFVSALSAAIALGSGCGQSDPLAGWIFRPFDEAVPLADQKHYHLDKAVVDDYQAFIKENRLSPNGALTGFYEDGAGQHAVSFEANPYDQNSTWRYTLIYDKNNKRIKVTKSDYHRYQS